MGLFLPLKGSEDLLPEQGDSVHGFLYLDPAGSQLQQQARARPAPAPRSLRSVWNWPTHGDSISAPSWSSNAGSWPDSLPPRSRGGGANCSAGCA